MEEMVNKNEILEDATVFAPTEDSNFGKIAIGIGLAVAVAAVGAGVYIYKKTKGKIDKKLIAKLEKKGYVVGKLNGENEKDHSNEEPDEKE